MQYTKKIDAKKLGELLLNQEQTQLTLDELMGEKSYSLSDLHQFSGDQNKNRKTTLDLLEEQQKLEERIRHNEISIAQTNSKSLKEEYEIQIAQDKARLNRVKDRLNRFSPSENILGITEYENNLVKAKALDELAIHIGEWFATGAAGPGTVTYEDKTFTAE